MKIILYLLVLNAIYIQCSNYESGASKSLKWPKLDQTSRDYIYRLRDRIEENTNTGDDILTDERDYLEELNMFNTPQSEYGPNVLIYSLRQLGFSEVTSGKFKIPKSRFTLFEDNYQDLNRSMTYSDENKESGVDIPPIDTGIHDDTSGIIIDNNVQTYYTEYVSITKCDEISDIDEECDNEKANILCIDTIAGKATDKEWKCGECTFINSPFLPKCEICSSPRQVRLKNENKLKYTNPVDIIYIGGMDCENISNYWGELGLRLPGFDPFEYCSKKISSRQLNIQINAQILNETIKQYFIYHNSHKILFVCHSMGGIYSSYLDLIPDGLVYMAVPHQGVRYNEFIRDRVIPKFSDKFENITLGHDSYRRFLQSGIPRTRTVIKNITRTIERTVTEYEDT